MEIFIKSYLFKILFTLALSVGFAADLGFAAGIDGRTVVQTKCAVCHLQKDGIQSRISFQRKTPEGWEMTVTRMQIVNGVQITPEEKRAVIKYLSDEFGLAPEETKDYQYLLERKDWIAETFPEPLAQAQAVCARCHSFGRAALQRRTLEDWLLHVDFHLGSFPTVEYQAGGRNIDWYGEAKKVVEVLAKEFPFESDSWKNWKSKPNKPDPQGKWRVVGYQPGMGDYQGVIEITRTGEDQYKETFAVEYGNGTKLSGTGTGIIYAGFQWRASVKLDNGGKAREVHFLSEDGNMLSGRWFLPDHNEIGGEDVAYKIGSGAKVLAVNPKAIKASQGSVPLKIFGVDLPQNLKVEDISLGEGLLVTKINGMDGNTIAIEVAVDGKAPVGKRDVQVGQVMATGLLGVYDKIDYIKVIPDSALARTGGTTAPKQFQQFEAIAFSNGADGAKGTEDDIDLGLVKAQWEVKEFFRTFDEEDVKHMGSIDQNGLYTPGGEGPNPERPFETNNAGDAWIVATYQSDGAKPLMARAFLIVTLPRWNKPPLR
jgi:quinohemoprotein amine dehydrogenase